MIILGFKPFQRGHLRTQNTTPLMLIFPNEINKLPRLRSGVNVECVFTVIAKWVARRPRILIVDEPTRGIDIGAKAEVHALLARLAQQGFSIIVISSDLPEVLAVSDRVLVIKQGRINGELNRSEAT